MLHSKRIEETCRLEIKISEINKEKNKIEFMRELLKKSMYLSENQF